MANPISDNTDSMDFAEAAPSVMVRNGAKGGAISTDGGKSWAPFDRQPTEDRGNTLAVAADAGRIICANRKSGVFVSTDRGRSWNQAKGINGAVSVVADRMNSSKFYAINDETVYASSDGGTTFIAAARGVANRQLMATPGQEGDLWLASGDRGLLHSTDGGQTFQRLPTVTNARHIATGKAAPNHHEALYLAGDTGNGESIYRSDDSGKSWIRLPDDQHQYGWLPDALAGDPRVYGRVYLGTNGRGVIYGEPEVTK